MIMNARTLVLPTLLGLGLLGGCAAPPPRPLRVVYVASPPRCAWIPAHWRWDGYGYRVWVPGHCARP